MQSNYGQEVSRDARNLMSPHGYPSGPPVASYPASAHHSAMPSMSKPPELATGPGMPGKPGEGSYLERNFSMHSLQNWPTTSPADLQPGSVAQTPSRRQSRLG